MEELVAEFMLMLKPGFTYSSMELLHLLGKRLSARGIKSIVAVAAENDVPIFCPAISDSAYGEANLMTKNKGDSILVDQVKELHQLVSIGVKTRDIGVVYIGRGMPKDFTQLLAISLSPKTMDQKVPGRKGFIRVTVKEYYYPTGTLFKSQRIHLNRDAIRLHTGRSNKLGKISSKGKRITLLLRNISVTHHNTCT